MRHVTKSIAPLAVLMSLCVSTIPGYAEPVVLECSGPYPIEFIFDESQGEIVSGAGLYGDGPWKEGEPSGGYCVRHVSFSPTHIMWSVTGTCNGATTHAFPEFGDLNRETGQLQIGSYQFDCVKKTVKRKF